MWRFSTHTWQTITRRPAALLLLSSGTDRHSQRRDTPLLHNSMGFASWKNMLGMTVGYQSSTKYLNSRLRHIRFANSRHIEILLPVSILTYSSSSAMSFCCIGLSNLLVLNHLRLSYDVIWQPRRCRSTFGIGFLDDTLLRKLKSNCITNQRDISQLSQYTPDFWDNFYLKKNGSFPASILTFYHQPRTPHVCVSLLNYLKHGVNK